MGLIIGLLTFVLVVNSLLLLLLILVQLPKKEAGAGLAFGGAASDALFGAGSGNVLTRITKYSAGVFLFMALFLSVLQSYYAKSTSRSIAAELENAAAEAATAIPPALVPTNTAAPTVPPTPSPSEPTIPNAAVTPGTLTTNGTPSPTATTADNAPAAAADTSTNAPAPTPEPPGP